uniref:aspartate dehydrogenase domain-containing protein n=1 Tax=Myxine glutinosa TaxID=7769 RepID=UPI00358E101C
MDPSKRPRRVGVVGYGHLGRFLVEFLTSEGPSSGLELAFVWNRSVVHLQGSVLPSLILHNLRTFHEWNVDLIVEVCHPMISKEFGMEFLKHADYLVGSPTALAEKVLEENLRSMAISSGHTLYIPSGALWGGRDIEHMAQQGTLKALTVTMTKHPHSFKLEGALHGAAMRAVDSPRPVVLFEGPVRDLCPLAPHNVNTMAAAALVAQNLGFDGVRGRLVADASLPNWHVIDIEIEGPTDPETGHTFTVRTTRRNPAALAVVTGSATYSSFLSSLLCARGHGGGLILC